MTNKFISIKHGTKNMGKDQAPIKDEQAQLKQGKIELLEMKKLVSEIKTKLTK